MHQLEEAVKNVKATGVATKVTQFQAISQTLSTMIQFMLVQRDSSTHRLKEIRHEINSLLDQFKKSKPKDDSKCIELLGQMKDELKNASQSSLKEDIGYMKTLKDEVANAINGTKTIISQLSDEHRDDVQTVLNELQDKYVLFEKDLRSMLNDFKITLKQTQDAVKADHGKIDTALASLKDNIATNNALITTQTDAINKNTQTVANLNTAINQTVLSEIKGTKTAVESGLLASQRQIDEERRKRDQEALLDNEHNKKTLDQIKTALIQNNKKAEEVKEASMSAVQTSFGAEYQKRKQDIDKVIQEESQKINQAVTQAMTTLAKSDEVDKVKDEVEKIAAHVDMQTTENLKYSINEAASKVATDNRLLVQLAMDEGLESAAKKGALKGLEKFNNDRAAQKNLKKAAAQEQERIKAEAQGKKDAEKKEAKRKEDIEKQARRSENQKVIGSLMAEAKAQTAYAQGAVEYAN